MLKHVLRVAVSAITLIRAAMAADISGSSVEFTFAIPPARSSGDCRVRRYSEEIFYCGEEVALYSSRKFTSIVAMTATGCPPL